VIDISSGTSTVQRSTTRIKGGSPVEITDNVVVEEPLELLINGMPYAAFMRMPGDDLHLCLGFCFTSGVLTMPEQVLSISHGIGHGGIRRLLIEVDEETASRVAGMPGERMSLSCSGHAGAKTFPEIDCPETVVGDSVIMATEEIQELAKRAVSRQTVFATTGATHFAALFDRQGELLAFAEDMGRHNALDKAIGKILSEGTLSRAVIAILSSRLSFEMVKKAAIAGIEILAGFSAATSFSIQLAEKRGMSLVGFLRPGRMNIYCNNGRIEMQHSGTLSISAD
jgi:FdhD protein